MDWDRLIPGHPDAGGRLGTKKDVEQQLAILQDASAEMKKLGRRASAGTPRKRNSSSPKYATLAGHEATLPFIGRRYCGLWGRGT